MLISLIFLSRRGRRGRFVILIVPSPRSIGVRGVGAILLLTSVRSSPSRVLVKVVLVKVVLVILVIVLVVVVILLLLLR